MNSRMVTSFPCRRLQPCGHKAHEQGLRRLQVPCSSVAGFCVATILRDEQPGEREFLREFRGIPARYTGHSDIQLLTSLPPTTLSPLYGVTISYGMSRLATASIGLPLASQSPSGCTAALLRAIPSLLTTPCRRRNHILRDEHFHSGDSRFFSG
jgi:hypothetical protein